MNRRHVVIALLVAVVVLCLVRSCFDNSDRAYEPTPAPAVTSQAPQPSPEPSPAESLKPTGERVGEVVRDGWEYVKDYVDDFRRGFEAN